MKVFCVLHDIYGDQGVVFHGVFATRELAEEFIRKEEPDEQEQKKWWEIVERDLRSSGQDEIDRLEAAGDKLNEIHRLVEQAGEVRGYATWSIDGVVQAYIMRAKKAEALLEVITEPPPDLAGKMDGYLGEVKHYLSEVKDYLKRNGGGA